MSYPATPDGVQTYGGALEGNRRREVAQVSNPARSGTDLLDLRFVGRGWEESQPVIPPGTAEAVVALRGEPDLAPRETESGGSRPPGWFEERDCAESVGSRPSRLQSDAA